ncbi:TetR/AcrR family transcriptional regulator [Salipiger sp. H15]|uniref:TetR/AcrR family transcriptional regulator n=1 Tax=Alloyangia sp. H15 TaxID=3029062 RepID=A0AAU8ALN9_9RHOB
MSDDSSLHRGWRGSRDVWLDAAYEALTGKGVDAVKIMPLANALQLSRTSFYWFFKDRQQLLDALLDRWEGATTAHLVAATRDYAATETEAMLNVISTFLSEHSFDARLELAVRSWAQQDAKVLARLQAADAERLAALREMLLSWGHDPADADVRARTIYLVQVGYISMRVEESLEVRLERFPNYVEIYTGKRPPEEEMARFKARIGAPPRRVPGS